MMTTTTRQRKSANPHRHGGLRRPPQPGMVASDGSPQSPPPPPLPAAEQPGAEDDVASGAAPGLGAESKVELQQLAREAPAEPRHPAAATMPAKTAAEKKGLPLLLLLLLLPGPRPPLLLLLPLQPVPPPPLLPLLPEEPVQPRDTARRGPRCTEKGEQRPPGQPTRPARGPRWQRTQAASKSPPQPKPLPGPQPRLGGAAAVALHPIAAREWSVGAHQCPPPALLQQHVPQQPG